MHSKIWPPQTTTRSYQTSHSPLPQVCFASFISGGFITAIVVNFPEKKLAKRTSVSSAQKTQEIEYVHYSKLAMRALIIFYKKNILLHFVAFVNEKWV